MVMKYTCPMDYLRPNTASTKIIVGTPWWYTYEKQIQEINRRIERELLSQPLFSVIPRTVQTILNLKPTTRKPRRNFRK